MKTSFYSFPLFLSFFFSLIAYCKTVSFSIPRFNVETKVLYEGDAVLSAGYIELNKINYLYRVGRATYAERVRLWDSASGKLSDFTSHFGFTIDNKGVEKYGHGIAFFLGPVGFQIPPNSAGGFLGLFNTTTSDSPKNQIITVEFDSFSNPEWDPPYEHVGININSIASVATARWNASTADNREAYIIYNATTKNLTVYWNYGLNSSFKGNFSLSYPIDLRKVLPEWVTVGFSAATGKYVENHFLNLWEFNSSLDVKETINVNDAKKIRILQNQRIRILLGSAVSGSIFILGVVIAVVVLMKWKQRRKKKAEKVITSVNDDLGRGAGPRRFSYEDLASATNNFSNERKLGQGGFGCVYKGYLSDLDLEVAIKKFSRGSRQGKKEYITEVNVITQLRHRNLVQLIGWSHDKGEFLLVYEFMPNGSLDTHLFGNKSSLTWSVRYKIAAGLASGLLYLHEEWERCVIHRDIKSSNIMLDSRFNVKLGDFGLARLIDHELGIQTTGLAGTLGYMAPEYITTGRATKESDVFSFGVVVLEISTGRKSRDPTDEKCQAGLVEWVWGLYERGELFSAVDALHMEYDMKEIECLLIVGLWCSHPDSTLRPSIRRAIQVLNFEAALPNLPVKLPTPMYQDPPPAVSSSNPLITVTSLDAGR